MTLTVSALGALAMAMLGSCFQLKQNSPFVGLGDASVGNGGWGQDAVAQGPFNRPCTVKQATIEQIQTGLVSKSEPFIIRGAMDWLVNSTSVQSFLERYGDSHLRTTGTSKGVRGFPSSDSPKTLARTYVQNLLASRTRNLTTVIWDEIQEPVDSGRGNTKPHAEPHPVRDLRDYGRAHGYGDGLPVVPDMQDAANPFDRHDSFILAGSGTGTYIHSHGDAMAALGWGRKYWVIVPGEGMEGTITGDQLAKLQELHPADAIKMFTSDGAEFAKTAFQVCTQNAGDIFHVPTKWLHVTVNLWPTASVTLQAGYAKY